MRCCQFPVVCLMTLLCQGCANWYPADNNPVADTRTNAGNPVVQPVSLMALDFINALSQIREVPPALTTVQLLRSLSSDPFTQSLQDALQAAGYGIRWVDDDVRNKLLQYRHEREPTTLSSSKHVYELKFGRIEMRRSYEIDAQNKVVPVSPLYIRGTDASDIVLNDAIFDSKPAPPAAALANSGPVINPVPLNSMEHAASVSNTSVSTSSFATMLIAEQSPLAVPEAADPFDGLVSRATSAKTLTLPLIAMPRVENVFELGVSNYEGILAGHRTVDEQILTFANDSLRLGELNKRHIRRMVTKFDPEIDIFSLIGCSLGLTRIEGGNAALALGRASRVREALLIAGVPQGKILDEGCWAGDSTGNALPRRGVVVTLNRKS